MKKAAFYDASSSDVDLTPMLDVVFILLIFFVITASFIKEQSLLMSTPSPQAKKLSEVHPTVLTVTSTNEILLDNRRVEATALRALMSQKVSQKGEEAALLIHAHELSSAETYVAVVDAARQANLHAISLTTYE